MKKNKTDRLTGLATLRIDPEKPRTLRAGLKRYRGFEGDTVATALYASGVRIFSKSLKYRRPRGLYSLDGECANCLAEIDGIPNVSTETTPLQNGMRLRFQTPGFSLKNGFMDMSAGFQYRRFHKPYALWPFFLKQIRNAAGFGQIRPDFQISGTCDARHMSVDVCVIGGGPAGMSAALAAAEQELDVILLEARPWPGGHFDFRTAIYEGEISFWQQARSLAEEIGTNARIQTFLHTPVTDLYEGNRITAVQSGPEKEQFEQRRLDIRATAVVIATGCTERPLIFENNDRPGVMQPECALRLAHTYGILPGEAAVFSVGHDMGLEAAANLCDLGVEILAVADCREEGQSPVRTEKLAQRKIPLLKGWAASEVRGKEEAEGVVLSALTGKETREFDCDLVAASAGLTPNIGPLALMGTGLKYDTHTGFFLPENLPARVYMAGRLTGLDNPPAIEAWGRVAGLRAAADCGASVGEALETVLKKLEKLPAPSEGSRLVQAPCKGQKAFVCFDADVTLQDIGLSREAGFDSAELVKRWTGTGTGPGQGGISGHNLPLLIAEHTGTPVADTRPTTIRPPLKPVLLATCAAGTQRITKQSPLCSPQQPSHAFCHRMGRWTLTGNISSGRNASDEVRGVRRGVGLMDMSPLGKFRIFGPDAEKALQRIYVGNMAGLSYGRAMYSAMCDEHGCLADHGVVAIQGENDYFLTILPERADETEAWFRAHTRHDGWDFHMVNLTDVMGTLILAGPRAREVLQRLTESNLSNPAFPLLGDRMLMLKGGLPVRVIRRGDLGEISYEIHVRASLTRAAWDLLTETGQDLGLRPFGPEARRVLRLEKGFLNSEREAETRTTLIDLGLGHLWDRKKSGFDTVGEAVLRETENQEGRMKRVGFKMEKASAGARLPKDGAIIVDDEIRGHVCLSRYSVTLDEFIGTALVESHLAEPGTRLALYEHDMPPDQRLYATVVPLPFYDPEDRCIRA